MCLANVVHHCGHTWPIRSRNAYSLISSVRFSSRADASKSEEIYFRNSTNLFSAFDFSISGPDRAIDSYLWRLRLFCFVSIDFGRDINMTANRHHQYYAVEYFNWCLRNSIVRRTLPCPVRTADWYEFEYFSFFVFNRKSNDLKTNANRWDWKVYVKFECVRIRDGAEPLTSPTALSLSLMGCLVAFQSSKVRLKSQELWSIPK